MPASIYTYLIDGFAKPAKNECLQPVPFFSRGEADKVVRLIIDGKHANQTQPAAYLGPTQATPKTVGHPSRTQEPPRNTGNLYNNCIIKMLFYKKKSVSRGYKYFTRWVRH